jgi:predicted Fe-Mo cluster-binding NifX family protein
MDAPLDQRFGRAENYIIVESEDGSFSALANEAKDASGGAGTQAVQLMIDNGVDEIVAPELGPKAFEGLAQFKIKAFSQGNHATVQDAFNAWKEHKLEAIGNASQQGLHKA